MTSGLKPASEDCHLFDCLLLFDLYGIHTDLQFSLEILALHYSEIFHDFSMLPLWPSKRLSGADNRGILVVFVRFIQIKKGSLLHKG